MQPKVQDALKAVLLSMIALIKDQPTSGGPRGGDRIHVEEVVASLAFYWYLTTAPSELK
jgi:hypothetical protein